MEIAMELPPGLRLSIEKNPSWEDRDLIDNGLGAYNAAFLHDNSYDYFGIFVRGDTDAIRAGLIGHVYAGWLFVNLLWVHADLRRGGIGRGLLAEAEGAARRSAATPPGSTRFPSRRPSFTGNSATGNLPGLTTRPTTSASSSKSR